MIKNKNIQYVCSECGAVSSRWSGKCFNCGNWNSLHEHHEISKGQNSLSGKKLELTPLADISQKPVVRIGSSLSEVDRVLGGGLVPGSVVLLGGEPGTGKSTLLLQYADSLAQHGQIYYLSAEESPEQVSMRALRLGLANTASILIAGIEHVDDIMTTVLSEKPPQVIILDSVQTITDPSVSAKPGSVSQVQSIAHKIVEFAKRTNIACVLVGHVTKEGSLAGPKTLEHLVDVVLYLEGDTEKKILRSAKNRFGSVNELALFNFEKGYFEETKATFLLEKAASFETQIGAVTTIIKEGGRYVPLEIQALVVQSYQQQPRRVVNGYDFNRLLLLLAILDRHTNNKFYNADVFINVSEGIRIFETAGDLALCIALVSSLKKLPIATNMAVWGEVSLLGSILPVGHHEQRRKEAERIGYNTFITPSEFDTIRKALDSFKKP